MNEAYDILTPTPGDPDQVTDGTYRAAQEIERLGTELQAFVDEQRNPSQHEVEERIERLHRVAALLRKEGRRRDQFIAILAHELRNPLAPIIHEIEAIKLDQSAPPELQRSLDVIERQSNQIAHLLKDLLDVSRALRGKIELQLQMIDLSSVIERAVETAMPLIKKANHTLTVDLPKTPIRFMADPIRLEQVIVNLLNNAAKYTDPNGHIWLSASQTNWTVTLTVRDSGIGIPEELLPRIFDLFLQADQSLARVKGGLGVGLGISRLLVRLHGGTITAESPGLGKGSEFIVKIPMINLVKRQDAQDITETTPALTPQKRIFIVEDDETLAESLARLLRKLGHEVSTAYSGADGLVRIPPFKPDVIFVDIAMPDMNGYQVARELRKMPDLDRTLIVALTGFGEDSYRQQSHQAGFDAHLVKPIGIKEITEILSRERTR